MPTRVWRLLASRSMSGIGGYKHAISDARMMTNICHTGKKLSARARNKPTRTLEVSLSTETTHPVQPLCIFDFKPDFSLKSGVLILY